MNVSVGCYLAYLWLGLRECLGRLLAGRVDGGVFFFVSVKVGVGVCGLRVCCEGLLALWLAQELEDTLTALNCRFSPLPCRVVHFS